MSDTTITSANSVFILTVPGLYPQGVRLQGFSADRAWNTNPQEMAETQMSIDGRQTGGFVPAPVDQTISFQADSPSKQVFVNIARQTKTNRDVIYISGNIDLPSTGESFTCKKGILINAKAIADAGKVLQAVDFVIRWEDIVPTLT